MSAQGLQGKLSEWVRSRTFLFYIASYLFFAAGGLRILFDFADTGYAPYVYALLAAYFVLLSTERPITARWRFYQPLYFVLQIAIVLLFTQIRPIFDYYALLFTPLFLQAIWYAPRKAAFLWIVLLTAAIVAGEIYLFEVEDGITYSLAYIAAAFFISILGIAVLRSERARAESQALLVELQAANRKLKDYAGQVEAFSAAQERTRLARELHDSVTQTIFSMTLTAESALILLDRDPARVKDQLKHLQSLSKNALAEMRSLIQHQHSPAIAEEGLVPALRRHALERQEKDRLCVELNVLSDVDPPPRLTLEAEECLFRVVQEALNNVVKHACTGSAVVTLDYRSDPILVTVQDRGAGFDPHKLAGQLGHLGLNGMEERVRSVGGRLVVESRVGSGTCIRIEGLRLKEPDHV